MTNKAHTVIRGDVRSVLRAPGAAAGRAPSGGAASCEAQAGEAGRARAVADYIAGMTDRYAIMEHERLFDPAKRS